MSKHNTGSAIKDLFKIIDDGCKECFNIWVSTRHKDFNYDISKEEHLSNLKTIKEYFKQHENSKSKE